MPTILVDSLQEVGHQILMHQAGVPWWPAQLLWPVQTIRQVLFIDGYYNWASEYLECGCCHKKYISWSDHILKQLDVGHRAFFPLILTYQFV